MEDSHAKDMEEEIEGQVGVPGWGREGRFHRPVGCGRFRGIMLGWR